jgi:Ca2+-transporting ATPase
MNADSIDLKNMSLTSSEVLVQRAKFGENRLAQSGAVSGFSIFLNQFKSPLIYIILIGAMISLLLGEIADFAIILSVVVLNVTLGFIQEFQAQKTFLALRSLLKPTSRVFRDGQLIDIEVWEIVPGDIVSFASGDKVSADGQLLESIHLAADEGVLTGESAPISKIVTTENTADVKSYLYMGSTIVTGRGLMKVTKTGASTELGKIASSLNMQEENKTPLQLRLHDFSRSLSLIVLGSTAIILAVGIVQGTEFFEMLRISIALAVAAVPEGLMIAVTVILVIGMRRIFKRQGLVKQLLAVETLGSVTVICTDKTGTLTEGRMTVDRVDLDDVEKSLHAMVLCNNNQGSLEVALWEHAQSNLAIDPQELVDKTKRVDEILFTSESKFMVTAISNTDTLQNTEYFLKGAPEIVLTMCDFDQHSKLRITQQIDDWAKQGLRLMGLAHRKSGNIDSLEGFIWVGLVGVRDPIRSGVTEAIAQAQEAGIKIKMITGDYRETALSIAKLVGISSTEDALDGDEIEKLSDAQLSNKVEAVSIFSRVRPNDKLRIVRALQNNKETVAMIGDGVNDAPALISANIGVVVGSATDVAKESADLVLLDNNFVTIVGAVEEGRVTYDNIQKVIAYVLSNSFAAVITIFGAMLLGWPAPLMIAQILWIHLICDGPADIVLGFEPKENGIMQKPPRSVSEPLLNRLGIVLIAVVSVSSSVFALSIFGYFANTLGDLARGQSVVFLSFAINSMVYIFAYRSLRTPLWRMTNIRQNKPLILAFIAGIMTAVAPFFVPVLGSLLGIVALGISDWLLVVTFAVGLLVVVEIAKLIMNRKHN